MIERVALVDIPTELQSALHEVLIADRAIEPVWVTGTLDPHALSAVGPCDTVVLGYPDEQNLSTAVDVAGRGTWNVWQQLRPRLLVQLSSTAVMDGYPPGWSIDESWAPLPTEAPESLALYLAEVLTRELSRVRGRTVVLRTDGRVADSTGPAVGDSTDSSVADQTDRTSVQDVALAVVRTLAVDRDPDTGWPAAWQVRHLVSGAGRLPLVAAGDAPLRWAPRTADQPSRIPRTVPVVDPGVSEIPQLPGITEIPVMPDRITAVCDLPVPGPIAVFGAGGPLGVVSCAALSARHPLRMTDNRPFAAIAAQPPQSPGAPLPVPVSAPHTELCVDVTDAEQVRHAAQGMDALVNCSVVRVGEAAAFRVNVLGALHVMMAAQHWGIPRVVHTGPTMGLLPHPVGLYDDPLVRADAPDRAGDNLYFLTKLLGRKLCEVLARQWSIATPVLLFNKLLDPELPLDARIPSFSISWRDAGRAVAAAAVVARLPSMSPSLLVMADSPHGNYDPRDTYRILQWQPQDDLRRAWHRPSPREHTDRR